MTEASAAPGTRRPGPPEPMTPKARRAAVGAGLGYFVDFYDIYLPTLALAPALAYFQPDSLGDVASTTLYYITFVTTLLGRPIGAFLFGHLADTIGRRRSTVIAISGFGVVTLLIGLLPGYGTWGWWSMALLILLRLVDGVFLGGEYTAAVPLAMEGAPHGRRGRVSVRIMLGYPSAFIAISLLTLLMLDVTTDHAYLTWGWRIPFFIGALLSVVVLLYFRRVEEPAPSRTAVETAQAARSAAPAGDGGVTAAPAVARAAADPAPSPLKQLLSPGPHRRSLMQIFLLMTGMWLSLQTAVSMMPGLLTSVLKLPSVSVTLANVVVFTVLALVYLAIGRVADTWGRRRVLVMFGVLTATVVPALYVWMIATAATSGGAMVRTLVLAGVVVLMANAPWGILSAYIPERFPAAVRASGFGVGYTLAVVVPSCYSFFLLWLAHLMPYRYTQIPLVVLGGVLAVAGALLGPETKDVDFRVPPPADPDAPAGPDPSGGPATTAKGDTA